MVLYEIWDSTLNIVNCIATFLPFPIENEQRRSKLKIIERCITCNTEKGKIIFIRAYRKIYKLKGGKFVRKN